MKIKEFIARYRGAKLELEKILEANLNWFERMGKAIVSILQKDKDIFEKIDLYLGHLSKFGDLEFTDEHCYELAYLVCTEDSTDPDTSQKYFINEFKGQLLGSEADDKFRVLHLLKQNNWFDPAVIEMVKSADAQTCLRIYNNLEEAQQKSLTQLEAIRFICKTQLPMETACQIIQQLQSADLLQDSTLDFVHRNEEDYYHATGLLYVFTQLGVPLRNIIETADKRDSTISLEVMAHALKKMMDDYGYHTELHTLLKKPQPNKILEAFGLLVKHISKETKACIATFGDFFAAHSNPAAFKEAFECLIAAKAFHPQNIKTVMGGTRPLELAQKLLANKSSLDPIVPLSHSPLTLHALKPSASATTSAVTKEHNDYSGTRANKK